MPVWAERVGRDPWHPGHIAERYGLFVIILLGEGVLAATNARAGGARGDGLTGPLVVVGIAGLVILVGLWWMYFLAAGRRGAAAPSRVVVLLGLRALLPVRRVAAVGAAPDGRGGSEVTQAITHHIERPDVAVG